MADDKDEKGLLAELRKMKTDSEAVRRPHEGIWYRNLAFVLGEQWSRFDGTRLVPCEVLPHQSKPVDNRMALHTKIAIAKQTKQRPTFTAAVTSVDQADIESALIGEEVFEDQWIEQNLAHLDRRARFWRYVCGSGWLKVTWDRDAGESTDVLLDPDGEPITDETGAPVNPDDENAQKALAMMAQAGVKPERRRVAVGDARVELRSPFQIYTDPLGTEEGLKSLGYLIEESVQDVQATRDRFPMHAQHIKADTPGGLSGVLPRMSALPTAGKRDRGAGNVGVKVFELWQLPNGKHEQGRHIIYTEKVVLLEEPMIYPWLPYAMYAGDPSGEFWPKAPATDLVQPQIRVNKRIQQIDDSADRLANPALTYPLSIRDQMEKWEGQVGEHIGIPDEFVGVEAKYLQAPNLPNYVDADLERAYQSLREIAGQNEVSTGLVPAGVTAASAINLIQEANDTQLGPDVVSGEEALEDIGRKLMWILARNVTDERIARIAGEDGDWDLRSWRGKQLDGSWEMKVQAMSGLPRSKAAKQAAMSQMMDLLMKYSGGLPALDQRNLRRFLSEYEVGALEKMFSDIAVDEQKVRREHRRLGLGMPLVVHPRDNHQFEIDAHNEWRKTPRAERMMAANPQLAAALEAHISEHEMAMVKEAQRQNDLALVMQPPPSHLPPPVDETVNGNSQSQSPPQQAVTSP